MVNRIAELTLGLLKLVFTMLGFVLKTILSGGGAQPVTRANPNRSSNSSGASKSATEKIAIEFLDESGHWKRSTSGILNNSQSISRSLNDAKRMYPKYRIRAVGHDSGRLYDMLQ
jgi:hypothetical protein